MNEIPTCKECGGEPSSTCAGCGEHLCEEHVEHGTEDWCFDCWESVGCVKETTL